MVWIPGRLDGTPPIAMPDLDGNLVSRPELAETEVNDRRRLARVPRAAIDLLADPPAVGQGHDRHGADRRTPAELQP